MSHTICCSICNSPVDLSQDRYTDEEGHIVHERCYVNRLAAAKGQDPPSPQHTQ